MSQAYPLAWPQGWPRARKDGKFTTAYARQATTGASYKSYARITLAEAVKRVLYELDRLGVPDGEAIISTNLILRLDGLPRTGQPAPADPGAAVYWRRRSSEPTRVMAIDRYARVEDNIAAIAATLEAMRAIERHGGAQILDRAFTGFAAIGAPDYFDPWAVLGLRPGASREMIEAQFRQLAKKYHPDAGGDAGDFHKIQKARAQCLGEASGV